MDAQHQPVVFQQVFASVHMGDEGVVLTQTIERSSTHRFLSHLVSNVAMVWM
jgi:hypothetical protein